MPKPQFLQKAQLTEILPSGGPGKAVEVQFNPQTLKLNYSNNFGSGTQPQGSSPQFVGTGATKLSMELWFDVTLPLPKKTTDPGGDVRKLTSDIVYFMTVQNADQGQKQPGTPPKLKFQWGSFVFNGTMDSMDETIDLFSSDGVPLRSSVSINLSKHDLTFEFAPVSGPSSGAAGTTPLTTARSGDSLPQLAAQAGISDWQGVARANGIDNPRLLQPGALINLSITA
jgi:Contractile injection system tube protein